MSTDRRDKNGGGTAPQPLAATPETARAFWDGDYTPLPQDPGPSVPALARTAQVARLYERHAAAVRRLAGHSARVPETVIEDACQTAWARLCQRADVYLDDPSAIRWVVRTATREAWRYTTRRREMPVGGWLPDPGPGELPEPHGDGDDPAVIAAEHDHLDRLRQRLETLAPRERQFLGLQAAGLSYREIAVLLGVSLRTVERQILRGHRKLRDSDPTP